MDPQAVGTLRSSPFGELLVQAFDHRLTGTLVLEETTGTRHGIYLEAGTPRKAKLGDGAVHLGELLVETGAISSEVHAETLARALRDHILHGQLLVGEGRISEDALGTALREQLHRQLVHLFRQPDDTHYGYFEGQNFLERWGAPAAIEPSTLEVLWRGLSDHAPFDAMESALDRVAGLRITLHGGLPGDHFAFMGEDRKLVALFAKEPRRLRDIIAAEPLLEADIRRVAYFLLLTRSVDLGVASAPPLGVAVEPVVVPPASRLPSLPSEPARVTPPPPETPAASAPSDAPPIRVRRDSPPSIPPAVVRSVALRDELRRLAEKPPRTHYEVLGIPEDATLRQVQAAFFLLSKHWHPDRLGPDNQDLKRAATGIFENIAAAYRVLADPAARTAYDDSLTAGASLGSSPGIERALSADLAFQKAESFLARGNLEGAEREAQLALKLEPGRAEHIALAAWLRALKPNADERQIGIAFARALKASQSSIKVHFYRGLFLKRIGRHAAALQEFRHVAERDARNIDAAREVRLYEQRLQRSPKDRLSLAPEEPMAERSAWSRLFKRRG
ncbi:MAG TPA: J domain-containing protein [Polyangiaceae bacterium]|nr:J domain-containing protein [Polyangiaceae bacterium]